jgi:DNA-binding transcriptional ArsR family regulator
MPEDEKNPLEQVRALSHPLRLKLLEMFARGPMTTKQAAAELGEPPTRLYHHVAALERAGLVRLRETRQNRGTTEKYFEIASRPMLSSSAALAGSTPADHAAMGMVVFEQARTELVRALAAGLGDGTLPFVAVRGLFALSPSAARELADELTALLRRLAERRGGEAGASDGEVRRYSLTVALIPTAEE